MASSFYSRDSNPPARYYPSSIPVISSLGQLEEVPLQSGLVELSSVTVFIFVLPKHSFLPTDNRRAIERSAKGSFTFKVGIFYWLLRDRYLVESRQKLCLLRAIDAFI